MTPLVKSLDWSLRFWDVRTFLSLMPLTTGLANFSMSGIAFTTSFLTSLPFSKAPMSLASFSVSQLLR